MWIIYVQKVYFLVNSMSCKQTTLVLLLSMKLSDVRDTWKVLLLAIENKNPTYILILQKLCVIRFHELVLHNGLKETFNKIKSKYRILKARNFIRQVIRARTKCKKHGYF